MPSFSDTNVLTNLDESVAANHELKAVQAARMSTLVIALLTTVFTIISQ